MKDNLTKKIVIELWEFVKDIGGLINDIAFTPYGQLRIGQMPGSTYYDRLHRFEKCGLVTKEKQGRVNNYKLTPRGLKVFNRHAQLKKRTDGLSTIVIFDVPVEKNRERTFFRRFLLRNGFKWIQKSVLASSNYLPDEVKEVAKELTLVKYVTIITGKISPMI